MFVFACCVFFKLCCSTVRGWISCRVGQIFCSLLASSPGPTGHCWWNGGWNMVEGGGRWCNVVERGGTWCNVVEHGGTILLATATWKKGTISTTNWRCAGLPSHSARITLWLWCNELVNVYCQFVPMFGLLCNKNYSLALLPHGIQVQPLTDQHTCHAHGSHIFLRSCRAGSCSLSTRSLAVTWGRNMSYQAVGQ